MAERASADAEAVNYAAQQDWIELSRSAGNYHTGPTMGRTSCGARRSCRERPGKDRLRAEASGSPRKADADASRPAPTSNTATGRRICLKERVNANEREAIQLRGSTAANSRPIVSITRWRGD